MQNIVTDKDYDSHILEQGIQFQIDEYYCPKEASKQYRIKTVLDNLNPSKGEKILDLGCGVGTFAYNCTLAGALAWGIDYSGESIKVAEQLCKKFNVANKTQFIRRNIDDGLPFNNDFFDKIVSADFIEHIYDEQKIQLLSEIKRILKPDGIAVIFTPNAIREAICSIKRKIIRLIGKEAKETRLHYGLINRFRFEKMIRDTGFTYKTYIYDINIPFLAKIPLLKEILALNLLWVIKKGG